LRSSVVIHCGGRHGGNTVVETRLESVRHLNFNVCTIWIVKNEKLRLFLQMLSHRVSVRQGNFVSEKIGDGCRFGIFSTPYILMTSVNS